MSLTPDRWQRIESLYHAALDRPADQRAGFLDEACPDEELRHEVETLLRVELKDDALLNHSPFASLAELQPGAELGPYRITGRIGAGGMAWCTGRSIPG